MKTNRREFLRTASAGAAALGLAGKIAAAETKAGAEKKAVKAAETFPVHLVGPGRRKMMWPIKSELKSVRIKHDAPIDPVSWAYMKELRENNKTRVIYPVNPYVEVYTLRKNLFGLFTHNLDGGGDVWMFLTVGPEKALLIDTAYGLGDLKGLCDKLTGGKPLYVANTHEHFDHAYGNARFDKIYCHEYLAPYLAQQNPHMFDYLFDDYGDNIWVEFDRNDLPKFKKYEIAGVPDGYKFDLGKGYEIELMYQGGHSAGHACFIDKQNRIVFTGDNIIVDTSGCGTVNAPGRGPHGEEQLLSAYRKNLKRLVDRGADFDWVYPSHFMIDVDKSALTNEMEAIDAILKDPNDYDFWDASWGKSATAPAGRYMKHINQFSVVYYGYNKG